MVTGRDSEKGSYQGFAQVKDDHVIRIVRFSDFQFMGNKVETVWDGQIHDKTVDFTLKPNDSLTRFNDDVVTAEQMKNPVRIHQEINLDQPIQFLNSSETWTLFDVDPGAEPLWKNDRHMVKANGDKGNWILKVANFLGIKKVIDGYRKMAAKTQWGNRKEFRNNEHWAIIDHTDFDFYKETKDVVRVTNKTLSPVSMAEATQRKNAFGKTLHEKAAYFEQETKNYNLNSLGMLEVAHVDQNQNKIGAEVDYDSTLWTGVYIWAEVLRYKQTQNPEAYENVKAALKGLVTLTKITGDAQNFARTLIVSPSSEKASRDGLVQGKGDYAEIKWQQIGNNDMSKGLFIGFASAFSILKKEDAGLKKEIAEATKRMVNYAPIKERGFNLSIAYGLVALYNHDVDALQRYSQAGNNLTTALADALNVDSGFYYESIADWSGIHLSTISTMADIVLARELQDHFSLNEGDYKARAIRKNAEDRLYEMARTYKNARRDFLTIMAYAFSPEARTASFKQKAQEALWTLREFPAPRNIGFGEVDHTLDPNWSLSAWPLRPWKAIKGPFKLNKDRMNLQQFAQGAYSYPLYEVRAWQPAYSWIDNPFDMTATGSKDKVYFSSDYMLIYRVALQSGLITPED